MTNGGGQFTAALGFLARHPSVWWDVIGFAACGAIGQVFICTSLFIPPWIHQNPKCIHTNQPPKVFTLQAYGSLYLVAITVTRKMLTMIFSVFWFGHRLGGVQMCGVGLVFGGIGAEAWINKQEKEAKAKAKVEKEL